MRRPHVLPLALVIVTALLAGGWFFRVQKTVDPVYTGTVAGDAAVSVRFEPGTAEEAADRAAASYRAAGWDVLPVSTRTFKLFARGHRTAALLAEDSPAGGARVTEFRRGSEL